MRALVFFVLLLGAGATASLVDWNSKADFGGHCGCLAGKGQCFEPCSQCCGPGGIASCFSGGNPNATGGCRASDTAR